MSFRSRPPIGVFAVEDTSVQLTWRGLRPGLIRIAAADTVVELESQGDPGVAVLGKLPSGRHLSISVTGSALEAPVTLRARTLDPLPGEELARVATISDLHFGTEVFGHRGTIVEHPAQPDPHPWRCAEAAVHEAADWGASRIVAKGDLTNNGQVDQWRRYAALVDGSPVPIDGLPGNHDRAFRPERPGLSPEAAAAAFGLSMAQPITVRDVPGLRLVLADTTTPHRNRGQIDRITDLVLDAVHGADRGGAVLVALHHQLQPHRPAEGWPIGIAHHDSLRFLARLGASSRNVLVTSGHTHRHRRWSHAGVVTTQVGSTKDYPGVWAGYVVHEGGMRQVVHRVGRPDCLAWTDHTRRAALGTWRWVSPGRLDDRCFGLRWAGR